MSVSFIFNDASIPFLSIENCKRYLPRFFSILRKATQNEVQIIRTRDSIGSNWYNVNYVDGFSLSQWIEQLHDIEYKRFIRGLMDRTKSPLVRIDEIEVLRKIEESEFVLPNDKEKAVYALGVAFLLEAPAVSCYSMNIWYENTIGIIHNQFDEKDNEVKKDCVVQNISQIEHIDSFLEALKKERQDSLNYLKGLKISGNPDFENLIFCQSVLRSFKSIGINKTLLKKLKVVLGTLNNLIKTKESESSIIDRSGLDISGESDTTKNNRKLSRHRVFRLPNGDSKMFDLHVKNFPDQRLYFLPDFESKKIYIGYFGKHLPLS